MTEEQEQQNLITWLKYEHPTILFRVDYSAGMKMSINQARKMKAMQSVRGWPDIFIAAPRDVYKGLFIEFKKTGNSPYKKNGDLKADPHLMEQQSTLYRLSFLGYRATFATGFDEAKRIINHYLQLKK